MRPRKYGKGIKRPGQMNRTEQAYANLLELRKRNGELHEYKYEGVKLRLADKTFYTPDFFVMLNTGEIEFHEVKGFMLESANVKIKVANEQFNMFKFFVVRLAKGRQWSITEV